MDEDDPPTLFNRTYRGSKLWIIGTSLLIPYLIVLLAFHPTWSSFFLRSALAPLAFWAMWEIVQTYVMDKPDDVQLYELAMACTLSVTIRYAFTSTPPSFHPLPRRPPLAVIRSNRFFKAFNIIASDYRHINMPPNPPLPLKSDPARFRLYLRAVGYRLIGFLGHTSMMDIILYPAYMADPTGLGALNTLTKRDDVSLEAFCRGGRFGGFGCWFFFAFAVAIGTIFAMMGTYHLFALLGVGSGLYIDEEWPRFMIQPWKADSLNDLWGRRYHQMLRDTFLLWAKPFSNLPRPIHIMSIFLASAIFHILVYRPITKHFVPIPLPLILPFPRTGLYSRTCLCSIHRPTSRWMVGKDLDGIVFDGQWEAYGG